MRTFILLSCFILPLIIQAQTSAALVSMNGIGEIKVGMSQGEIEKLTGKKIKLVNLVKQGEDWSRDTIRLQYKGIDYSLLFDRSFHENSRDYIVYEISSHTASLKTRSGIGIGDDKLKIVSTYYDFTMHLHPEWEGMDHAVKSKNRSLVWLFGDTSETVIVFHLTNNKVTGFTVMYHEGC